MKELNIYGTNYQGKILKTRIACRAIIIQDGKILISYEKNNNKLIDLLENSEYKNYFLGLAYYLESDWNSCISFISENAPSLCMARNL